MRVLQAAARVVDRLVTYGMWVAMAGMVIMLTLVGIQVTARTIGRPVDWAIEVPAFSMTLVVAVALAYTQKVRGHISVALVEQRLGAKSRNILAVFLFPVYIGMVIFYVWAAFRFATKAFVEEWLTVSLHYPMVIPISFIVFGTLLLCLQVIVDMAQAVGRARHKAPESGKAT